MSELKYILDIAPDRYGTKTETKHVSNVPCPRCGGRGGFLDETGRNEQTFTPCSLCDGTKKVKATITVEWSADFGL